MISNGSEKLCDDKSTNNQDENENDIMLKTRSMILYCDMCKKLVNSVVTWKTNDIKNEDFKFNFKFPYLYPAIPCIYYLQVMEINNFANVVHKCPECDNILESFSNTN